MARPPIIVIPMELAPARTTPAHKGYHLSELTPAHRGSRPRAGVVACGSVPPHWQLPVSGQWPPITAGQR
ncbi:hypothetical protein B296_00021993 [Ensete ventricosum]|uniref:Uncharacterized protein n=1 Tax=Ensete ventricosum TaxID=4639 RepID=A0A426YIS6_ENSVE|nr:hypothetical protein B296_00021993 [Ensete ventricosum]